MSSIPASASPVANVIRRAEAREPLTVVFLGGSLTWGANASDPQTTSYRGRMMTWLRQTYPHTPFTFHDAAIGGTGSQLALFRLERDVRDKQPDLVFLDFTVNDDLTTMDAPRMASYETVLRHLLVEGIAVLPVLMCTRPAIENTGTTPPRYAAHRRLAEAYGLTPADTLKHMRLAVTSGSSLDELYVFANDTTHPGDKGYAVFFEAAREAWLASSANVEPALIPDTPVNPGLYGWRSRQRLAQGSLAAGWEPVTTYRTAMWFDGLSSRWIDSVVAADKGAHALEVAFHGSLVGLFGERDALSAPFRIWIDGKPLPPANPQTDSPDLWDISTARISSPTAGPGHLFNWTLLADDLAEGGHTLRIEPDFSRAHPQAQLRLESVCSAGTEPPRNART
jgi:lysophospholipase L1-like esterase